MSRHLHHVSKLEIERIYQLNVYSFKTLHLAPRSSSLLNPRRSVRSGAEEALFSSQIHRRTISIASTQIRHGFPESLISFVQRSCGPSRTRTCDTRIMSSSRAQFGSSSHLPLMSNISFNGGLCCCSLFFMLFGSRSQLGRHRVDRAFQANL